MSNAVYEASVYSREITYVNTMGVTRTVELYFALDPLQLLVAIANFTPKKSRSGNPAKKDEVEFDDAAQVRFVRDLCIRAAGEPSEDGESWYPFKDFENTFAGKAFLTKLAASDADRKEFAEKVLLAPFRTFVDFAKAEPDNTPADIQMFENTLKQLENIFSEDPSKTESLEERRARLKAEMAALESKDDA